MSSIKASQISCVNVTIHAFIIIFTIVTPILIEGYGQLTEKKLRKIDEGILHIRWGPSHEQLNHADSTT
jgi:hypothetical protein